MQEPKKGEREGDLENLQSPNQKDTFKLVVDGKMMVVVMAVMGAVEITVEVVMVMKGVNLGMLVV